MNEKPSKSAVGTEKERATADRLAGQATDAISSAKTAIQNTVGTLPTGLPLLRNGHPRQLTPQHRRQTM